MAEQAIRVEGLAEMRRAFSVASRELSKDLTAAVKSAADPVRYTAEAAALGIPRMSSAGSREHGVPWARMRVGITRHTAYVAPVQRGVRGRGRRSRPNLFDLLMGRALEPALASNRSRVEQEFVDAVTDMCRAWERV